MTAPSWPRPAATVDINHLRQGATYEARTQAGLVAIAEYLGIEVASDESQIVLRDGHPVDRQRRTRIRSRSSRLKRDPRSGRWRRALHSPAQRTPDAYSARSAPLFRPAE